MALLSARLNIGRVNAARLHWIGADTVAPTPPQSLAITLTIAHAVTLTWQASTDYYGIARYYIERCKGPGCTTFVAINVTPGTTYTDPTVDPLTTYRYRVRAGDASGNLSGYSNIVAGSTPDLAVPQNLAVSATTVYRVTLTWQQPTDGLAVRYHVERCTGPGCSTFGEIGTSATLSYVDNAVNPLTTYRYRVRAEDADGHISGGYSNIVAATTPDRADLTNVWIKVGSNWVKVNQYARVAGATVTQALNEVIDTAAITFDGAIPYALKGLEISINDQSDRPYFAGHITAVRTIYEGRAKNVAYACDCLDYTWLLNSRKVSARYAGPSSAILSNLVQYFAPAGFTYDQSALFVNVTIDEITFTNEELGQALSRTCERGGIYWYVDFQKVIRVFSSNGIPSAGTIDDTHPRTAVKLAKHDDAVAIATRVIARGGGSTAAIDLPVGSTTLPIDDPVWYTTGGGLFVECGPQRIAYSGVSNPGTGALVGTGNAPTTAPVVAAAAGSNLAAGALYQYAVSFVTSAGETLAGASVAYRPTGATIAPPPPPTVELDYYSGSKLAIGGTYKWALEWKIQGGGRVGGAASTPLTITAGDYGLPKWVRVSWASSIFNGVDPSVIGLYVHRTTNNGSTFYYDLQERGRNQGSASSSDLVDSDLVQMGQMSGAGAGLLAASLAQIPTRVGATARKIYRTVANGSQLKLVATIADNTTTTLLDTVTDAALGVNAPITDTSGIQSGGQVNAGASAILVSNVGPFPPAGGWVRVSGLTLRYAGVSGSSLVLAAPLPTTLSYGSEILNAPHLTGIPASGAGSIVYPIKGGDEVYVLVVRDDAAAQSALATATGGDGIREEFLTDGRLAIPELTARADATLAMRKQSLVTLTFDTRDPAVVVGTTITVNTTKPPIVGTFLIQRVTISQFQARGSIGHPDPLRVVEASSRRYTFDDLVQQIKLLGRIN